MSASALVSPNNTNRQRRRRGRVDAAASTSTTTQPDAAVKPKTTKFSSNRRSSDVTEITATSTHGRSSSSLPPLQSSVLLRDPKDDESAEVLWYDLLSTHSDRNATIATTSSSPPSSAVVARYRAYADQLYRHDVQLANHSNKNGNNNNNSKDDQWMESTMRKGTLKDRIAAMSVVVSTHPLHKLYALDSLLHLTTGIAVGSGGNGAATTATNARVAQLAAQAVEDVFLHTLLPPHRKLIPLSKRPLLDYADVTVTASTTETGKTTSDTAKNAKSSSSQKKTNAKTLSPRILLLWRYEEMIQERYDLFLRHYISSTLQTDTTTTASLTSASNNNSTNTTTNSNTNTHPEVHKLAALKVAAQLLRSVPEGEDRLLSLLVNKLGDRSAKVCATAAHELRRTLVQHSAMQTIVAREVQQLAHRPHLSRAALYNCILFLNQLQLTRSPPVSSPLGMSSKALKSTSSVSVTVPPPPTSLAASLMTTYFRIFDMALQESNLATTTSSSHAKSTTSPGTTGAMVAISQSRLISALLQGVNRAHPYLPTADQDMQTHLDALYRVVHAAPPGAKTQALLLLFHVAVGTTTELTTAVHSPTPSRAGKQAQRHEKQRSKETLNAATSSSVVARRDRFYRALYSTLSDPAMIGGGKHLTMYFNLLYKSIKYDTDVTRIIAFAKKMGSMALHCMSPVLAAVVFLLNEVGKDEHHPLLRSCYVQVLFGIDAVRILDPTKREPSGALVLMSGLKTDTVGMVQDDKDDSEMEKADKERLAPCWELAIAKYHFHPSVQKFAASMGDNTSSYSGDPLKDFALGPFLDKFAYRNPKSVERVAGRFKRGESVAERRSGTDSVIQAQFALPVNDPSYLNQSSSSNTAHEEFFLTFFRERARRDSLKGIKRHKSSVDDDEVERSDEKRQLDVLDREEARDVDNFANYEDLESKWESDEEEEAFVDSLAQQIIDDAMESNEHALDVLEDEDPDTEGWDDLYDEGEDNRNREDAVDKDDEDSGDDDDDDDDENPVDEEYDSENGDAERLGEHDTLESDDESLPKVNRSRKTSPKENGDVDAFMDDDSDSSDGDIAAAALLDGDDASENEDDDGEGESDDELDLAFVQDEDDDDENAPNLVELPSAETTFASADDYEELISKSWSNQKRSFRPDDEVSSPSKSSKNKRKKSR